MNTPQNSAHNIDEVIFEYQRNIRYYTDNIHEYNENMNLYFNSIFRNYNNNNTEPINQPYINLNNNRTIFNRPPINNLWYNIANGRSQRNETFMEDVVVRPTETQINAALETFVYIADEQQNTCPITLEPLQEGDSVCRIRYCNHLFKSSAIRGWFQRNVRCPVCRYDIRDYQETSQSQRQTTDDLQNEYNETIVDDLLDEITDENIPMSNLFNIAGPSLANLFNINQTSNRNPIANGLTSAIRSFVNSELERIPVNSATTELLYTFDIPLTIDTSGNYRL